MSVVILRLFLTPSITPTVRCSLVRHRAVSRKRDRKPRQRLPFSPLLAAFTVFAFAELLNALSRTGSLSPQSVKRAAYGRVTDSGFKKSYENNKIKK
jgi:hypothetical protein